MKMLKKLFGGFFFVVAMSVSAMEIEKSSDNDRIKKLITSVDKLGSNKVDKARKLRDAGSLFFLHAQLYNNYQAIIELSKEMIQNQKHKFRDKNTPIIGVGHILDPNDFPDEKDTKAWVGLFKSKHLLLINDPEYISISLLLREFFINPNAVCDLSQFPLFNSLMDFYTKDNFLEILVELIRYTQFASHLSKYFSKSPTWLINCNQIEYTQTPQLIDPSVVNQVFIQFPVLEKTIKKISGLLLSYTAINTSKKNYLDIDYLKEFKSLEEHFEKSAQEISFFSEVYLALKEKCTEAFKDKESVWVYNNSLIPKELFNDEKSRLPASLPLAKKPQLHFDAKSENKVVTDDAAKKALEILLKKNEDMQKDESVSSIDQSNLIKQRVSVAQKTAIKKISTRKNNTKNRKRRLEQTDKQESSFVIDEEEISNTSHETIEEIIEESKGIEQIPALSEKVEQEIPNNTQSPMGQAIYDKRVEDWFDNSIAKKESFESVLYHAFPKLVDFYLFKYGRCEQRQHATRKQMDMSYKLTGQIIFKGNVSKHVVFHATKDPKEVCYHRGLEWKPDNIFDLFSTPNFWKTDLVYRANSLPRISLDDYFKPLSDKEAELIKETSHHVEIRDHRLGVTIILYKV